MKKISIFINLLGLLCVLCGPVAAQETPPAPGAPRSVRVPPVREKILPNGMAVAVVEKRNMPLVTVQMLITVGAMKESPEKAGLANLTASLLTKGTKTRNATQIAEQIEFLGGSITTGAGWNSSVVSVNVTSDKLDQAMIVMSDVILRPTFKQDEIDLLKSQTLDGLTYNLKQPGFLASYVASRYSFDEHPVGGTPESLGRINRQDIVDFHKARYDPKSAVLIFTGDITSARANALAQKFFGAWRANTTGDFTGDTSYVGGAAQKELVKRILVIDLPNSGQASVNYTKKGSAIGRRSPEYFPASVMNSVLGGGYSSRLNQEIRIKRGLSYGAGSSFAWRFGRNNFSTRTQTKNESAAEVAELVMDEVKKLGNKPVEEKELGPRKLVLTGNFGSALETTGGIAGTVAELYSLGIPPEYLITYMGNVRAVTGNQIRDFARGNLRGGDIIIVGDAKIFMNDLKKRFSDTPIEVIKAAELDVSKDNLRK